MPRPIRAGVAADGGYGCWECGSAGFGGAGAVPDGHDRADASGDCTWGAGRADAAAAGQAVRGRAHRSDHPAAGGADAGVVSLPLRGAGGL